MDLTISPASSYSSKNNVSFGMAEFSKKGLDRAQLMGDVYEPLNTPHTYCPPEFFEKKKLFRKAPFAAALEEAVPAKKPPKKENVENISSIIVACGASKNAFANSKFIKQLVTTKDYVNSLKPEVKEPIQDSIATVLEANWDNPEISDNETRTLAEMALGSISEREEMALFGALDKAKI